MYDLSKRIITLTVNAEWILNILGHHNKFPRRKLAGLKDKKV